LDRSQSTYSTGEPTMQYTITKKVGKLTYWWDGTRFTSYALNQATYLTKAEAEVEATKYRMGNLIQIKEA
jgi:hypothetical protein